MHNLFPLQTYFICTEYYIHVNIDCMRGYVTWEIVTPRKPEVDIVFRGVTIPNVTTSFSQLLLYYPEC